MSETETVDVSAEGIGDSMRSLVDTLRSSANVSAVYGEPIEAEEKTIIPVARVAYGFGGGFGTGGDPDEETEGSGGGLGGGVTARPIGVVEVTDEGSRFVRPGENRRLGLAVVLGLALGFLLGRR